MKKNLLIYMLLIFGSIILIGCNKKQEVDDVIDEQNKLIHIRAFSPYEDCVWEKELYYYDKQNEIKYYKYCMNDIYASYNHIKLSHPLKEAFEQGMADLESIKKIGELKLSNEKYNVYEYSNLSLIECSNSRNIIFIPNNYEHEYDNFCI